MTMDDERLRAAFRQAVDNIDAPTARLVDTGIARGRRRRRLARVGVAGSGALVLAAAATVVVVAVGNGPAAAPDSTRAASQPAPAASLPVTSPAVSSASATSAPETVTVTPQALLQTTLDLLPARDATAGYAGNYFAEGFVGAQFTYDDGDGAALVMVSLSYPTDSGKGEAIDPPCAAADHGCTVLPDGAHAQARRSPQYQQNGAWRATEWDLDLVRPDGMEIGLIEYNAPMGKDVAPTREDPPFTVAQLTAIADSPRYRLHIPDGEATAADHLFRAVNLDDPDPGDGSASGSAAGTGTPSR